MTEKEWLACTDPESMLTFLRSRAGDRKLRLYAAACCRLVSSCLTQETLALLAVAERFADGLATDQERKIARNAAMRAPWHSDQITRHARGSAKDAVNWTLARHANEAVERTLEKVDFAGVQYKLNCLASVDQLTDAEIQRNAALTEISCFESFLLRDLFGNPFRPVTIDPSWQTPAVTTLAQTIYDHRRFDDMPLLADALEEAGCTIDEMLNHCRDPGEHVRGCWVVDLLLGKE